MKKIDSISIDGKVFDAKNENNGVFTVKPTCEYCGNGEFMLSQGMVLCCNLCKKSSDFVMKK